MLSLHVSNYITIRVSDIPKKLMDRFHAMTKHANPLFTQNKKMGFPVEGIDRFIYTRNQTDTEIQIYRGLLGAVIRACKSEHVFYEIIDERLEYEPINLGCTVKLRDYQEHPVEVMLKRQQTIGRGAAGSGKTEVFIAAAVGSGQPTLVLVWQTEQQEVWLTRARKYLKCEIGGIGGVFKEPVITPFTIGMVQSVRNRMDLVKDVFGCVICDEASRFAAETLREVVNELPAAYRFAASDDERRRDGMEFLLYATFGPLGWKLGLTQGQCPIDIVVVPTKFQSKTPSYSKLITELTEDEERNQLIINLAVDLASQGHKILIWSDRVGHCVELRDVLNSKGVVAGLIIGGAENKEEATRTKKGLHSGAVSVGLGTSVAEQSLNCPPLSAGIMTCASADTKMFRFRQMRGRLARPHESKELGTVYYLWDRKCYSLSRKVHNIQKVFPIKNAEILERKRR